MFDKNWSFTIRPPIITLLIAAIVGVFMLVAVGCDDKQFNKTVYSTVSAVEEARDQALTLAGEKYKQGKLTEEQKEKFIEIGDKVAAAGTAVTVIMADYTRTLETDKEEAEDIRKKVRRTMLILLSNYDNLVKLMEATGFSGNEIPKINKPEIIQEE